jgi:hypothetical protein
MKSATERVSWADVIDELERRAILTFNAYRRCDESGNPTVRSLGDNYKTYADMNRLLAEKIRKAIP